MGFFDFFKRKKETDDVPTFEERWLAHVKRVSQDVSRYPYNGMPTYAVFTNLFSLLLKENGARVGGKLIYQQNTFDIKIYVETYQAKENIIDGIKKGVLNKEYSYDEDTDTFAIPYYETPITLKIYVEPYIEPKDLINRFPEVKDFFLNYCIAKPVSLEIEVDDYKLDIVNKTVQTVKVKKKDFKYFVYKGLEYNINFGKKYMTDGKRLAISCDNKKNKELLYQVGSLIGAADDFIKLGYREIEPPKHITNGNLFINKCQDDYYILPGQVCSFDVAVAAGYWSIELTLNKFKN